jgi:hypothetical protein
MECQVVDVSCREYQQGLKLTLMRENGLNMER